MKHILTTLLLLLACCARAQYTPVQKYAAPSEDENYMLIHQVMNYPCRTITSGNNQYCGQTDRRGLLYGYGTYLMADGTQVVGQFQKGKMIFGITINADAAIVGNDNHHASYSLTTGALEYWSEFTDHHIVTSPEDYIEYSFLSMTYLNGDRYVGEVYRNRRHGYGIYYYANGDYWFGQYVNGTRNGFGAMFYTDGTMAIGKWAGEYQELVINIDAK